ARHLPQRYTFLTPGRLSSVTAWLLFGWRECAAIMQADSCCRDKFKIDHSERSRASRLSGERTPCKWQTTRRAVPLSYPASYQAAGIGDAEIAQVKRRIRT